LRYREWEEAMLKISFIDVIREDPILNFEWRQHGTATVPVNFGFGRVFKIGLRPINAYVQPEWTVRRPPYAGYIEPRFTLRFAINLLYPKES
jgi:hypothetical protein